jgi:MFS transporter, FSR family, fosmidomycin resistance protein
MVLSIGFLGLCIGLVVAGIGSSVKHPRVSLLVTDTYRKASRGPFWIYNFAGDLGKSIFPAIVAMLLTLWASRRVAGSGKSRIESSDAHALADGRSIIVRTRSATPL